MMDQENEGGDPDTVDYLQDPALWEDQLPQPYRMIEHIINQLLDDTWECIVQNEIYIQQKAAKVKIPEGTNGRVVCEDVLTQSLGDVCGGKEVVFIGNVTNIFAIDAKSKVISKQSLQEEVKSLVVVEREGLHVIIIQHDTEIEIFGFWKSNFVELIGFPHQFKDGIIEMCASPTCSHIAVTSLVRPNEEEVEVKLAVYTMPVEAWLSELPHVQPASQISVTSQKEVSFSKPSLLYTLCPPAPLGPVTSYSSSIFQSVCDTAGITVPSGQLHSLSKLYFENRRRKFVSKRQDFVSAPTTDTGRSLDNSTCHFLYYKWHRRQAVACELAVWWKGSHYLTIYPLQEPTGKSTTVSPSQHILQASPIAHSCISEDSAMLALALDSGVAVLWDVRIGICGQVLSCVASPDAISAIMFFQPPSPSPLMLGVGSTQGRVLFLDTSITDSPAKELNPRQDTPDSTRSDIENKVVWFEATPYLPSLLTSVHANGSLVIWNYTLQEPVCKLFTDHSHTISYPISSTFSSDGQQIFITAKLHEEVATDRCHLIGFDLNSVSSLAQYWDSSPAPLTEQEMALQGKLPSPPELLNQAETHLRDYAKLRLLEMDTNLVKWQKRWKELPNLLIEQKT